MSDQTPDDEAIAAIEQAALCLVHQAEALGLVLTITHKSLPPLAMRNYIHEIDVYPALKRQ